ncbi:uncharacterized protein RCO7_02627 [Rhynchosporium graminicola]|uniref:Uncharacterized protein n=1 Tax=Rhynchosporium graminicola TaxID=2792576 RepID=A0A1E1KFS5_9HELO|nr:uncharacterized protein RCO7_02627 [Rhynchosporium commune]
MASKSLNEVNDLQTQRIKQKTVQPNNGVKVEPAPHKANPIRLYSWNSFITDTREFIQQNCHQEYEKIKNDHIIQSSFTSLSEQSPALSARNGLVSGAIYAYNHHHYLVIRPEDVWFSILTQLNFYINANAEKLRSMFVAHEGKRKLVLVAGENGMKAKYDSVFGVDWASFSFLMGKKLSENILDPTLRDWFMPAFSTTTEADQATASIILMSSMQE